MSYLLFLDESGHDHGKTPYEIHGGIAIHASKLWSFVRALKSLEQACFGDALHIYGSELTGMKLLNQVRFKWAQQAEELDEKARRENALRFLNDGAQGRVPRRQAFTAFGQASLEMVHGIFRLLLGHEAKVFAVAIPPGIKPANQATREFLRKDFVFLLERYFRFLEENDETGLLVMDETEATQDRKLVRQLEAYFSKTDTGKTRSARIVPSPLFVSSDMTYPVQAADVCIYCLNWGFRIPTRGMAANVRPEIAALFAGYLGSLQHRSDIETATGTKVQAFSITYVPDPYSLRAEV